VEYNGGMWFRALLFFAATLGAETFKGTLMDVKCQGTNPAKHTKQCLMTCAGTGLGIALDDGTFYRFDEAGHRRALSVIEDSRKERNLRVVVDGKVDGETLRVDKVAVE
jgi:hypothetical protein